MKNVFFILILFLSLAAGAAQQHTCFDSDGGIQPLEFGRVTFDVVSELCLGDSSTKTCTSGMVSDGDFCKSSNTLAEQYCDQKGLPAQKDVTCQCEQGHCLSPEK